MSQPTLIRPISPDEPRTVERLQVCYVIERELANRLRRASKEERRRLYSEVYDELFQRVPEIHSLDQQRAAQRAAVVTRIASRLRRFLTPSTTFLEIGAGDLGLTLEIAPLVAHAYAVEVSNEAAGGRALPANVELVLSDGSSISLPDASVDLAFSNQLLEHLHPDDAFDHLRDVARALKPGGRYFCLTPSRISGPHDISMYFSDRPTGLHLKEYTTTELVRAFKDSGFSKVEVPAPTSRSRVVMIPSYVVTAIESLLDLTPRRTARTLAASRLVSPLLSRVIATK